MIYSNEKSVSVTSHIKIAVADFTYIIRLN